MGPAYDSRERDRKGPGRRLPGWGLWATLAALAAAGALYAWLAPGGLAGLGDGRLLWRRLALPLLRTVAFLAAGLLAGQLIEALGWTRRLGFLAAPLMRWARLPLQAATAFTASFVSGVAANAMLATSWEEGRLSTRQLVMANLLNAGLPAFFLHLPTTLFVAYALLGWPALVYHGVILVSALLRTLGVILAGRIMFTLPEARAAGAVTDPAGKPLDWAALGRAFLARLRRMLLIVLPVYVVIFLLAQGGFFRWLTHALVGVVDARAVPLEAMSVVVFAAVSEFTSGLAAAAALLESNGLSWSAVVIALLIGNLVATPVRALRHQLPHYMGIYSPATGVKLLLVGQSVRVVSVALLMIIFALLS